MIQVNWPKRCLRLWRNSAICGIIAFVTAKERTDPAQFLVEGLKRLEYRGYDSWGVAFGKDLSLVKKAGRISEAGKVEESPAYAGLGHTRWATHGGVTDANAHPHTDCTGRVVVAHNGIVENWEELKNELEEKGHEFKSETDTEVIAHLVESEMGETDELDELIEVVRRVFNRLEGLNAILVYFPQLRSIIAFRNGSPMVLGVGEEEHFIASDIPAFLPYTNKVVFINDMEGVVLHKGTAKLIDAVNGKQLPLKVQEVEWSAEEAELGEHPHYLIKEIMEQPQVLTRLAEYPEKDIKGVAKLIKESFGTYFTACGTAAHSGMAATYMFADLAKRHVNFAVGSEFYFLEDFLTPESLLIAASQSGETMDTLEAVRAAKRHKSKVVALVNVQGSSLTRIADKTLLLNCGPEKAVLATKSYTAKLAVFLLLASQLNGGLKDGRKLVAKAAKGAKELLEGDAVGEIKGLAGNLKGAEHLYVIGRGVNYPTALEAALKIKEVSYIHAEGFAGGELKHGVIALIEEGTPCMVFVANDRTKESVLSNAKEIKSRGGFIIGVSPDINEVFDVWIEVPDVGEASPIVNAIPAQLLAYYLAVERGLDPDKPRNLAKSVTVK